MSLDQSLTGFYRVGQKLSNVIPVLRITPRATEPSTVSVFLSSVKCGGIYKGTDLRTFWHRAIHFGQGVSTGWAKSSKQFGNF